MAPRDEKDTERGSKSRNGNESAITPSIVDEAPEE